MIACLGQVVTASAVLAVHPRFLARSPLRCCGDVGTVFLLCVLSERTSSSTDGTGPGPSALVMVRFRVLLVRPLWSKPANCDMGRSELSRNQPELS